MTVTLPPQRLEAMLIERTAERDSARAWAVHLEQELAAVTADRDRMLETSPGVLLRPWTDPGRRVLEDPGIRCACGGCDWIDGTHSADHCVPPEANDE